VSRNTALASAARRVRALTERLPEQHRPDLVSEWEELLERIDGKPDFQARRIIGEWLEEMEIRLSGVLLHAPLGTEDAA
jgi:hypothetical protein